MSKIDELKAEVEKLPREEFSRFFEWLVEKDWERWKQEIEADSSAGRLDFLVREAHQAKAKGTLKGPLNAPHNGPLLGPPLRSCRRPSRALPAKTSIS
jgi:hypothetical protein